MVDTFLRVEYNMVSLHENKVAVRHKHNVAAGNNILPAAAYHSNDHALRQPQVHNGLTYPAILGLQLKRVLIMSYSRLKASSVAPTFIMLASFLRICIQSFLRLFISTLRAKYIAYNITLPQNCNSNQNFHFLSMRLTVPTTSSCWTLRTS